MPTNTELVIEELKKRFFPKDFDLDDSVLLPYKDKTMVFFDKKTKKVAEFNFDYELSCFTYVFGKSHICAVMRSNRINRFLCVDWTDNELIILMHVLDEYGIKNYYTNMLHYKENFKKYDKCPRIYELIFTDDADSAAFEIYFNYLFHEPHDKKNIDLIIKNNNFME